MALQRGMSLLGVGLTIEAVYLVAVVRLPWWRYGGRLNSWCQILGKDWEPFAVCLAGIGVLMVTYVLGWRAVRKQTFRNLALEISEGFQSPWSRTRWVIWGGAILFAATLFWLMPITSDLFSYLSEAHMFTDLGTNPLIVAPLSITGDPLLWAYPIRYSLYPSVYGPAWVLLSAPGTLGQYDVAGGLFYLKGLAAVAYLGCSWLIERILRSLRPEFAVEGLYLFAWNPLVVLMAVGDGHNDIVMMAAVLLAFWLLLPVLDGHNTGRVQCVLGYGILVLSVWIKYISVVFMPLFLLYAWQWLAKERERRLWQVLAGGSLVVVGVSALVLLPFGHPEWMVGTAERLIRPLNWQGRVSDPSTWFLGTGLAVFIAWYAALVWRMKQGEGSFYHFMDNVFTVSLLIFLLGAVRSQPWHLLWPAALAGLSRRSWAWPIVVGLSAVLLTVQVWVEWGTPGIRIPP